MAADRPFLQRRLKKQRAKQAKKEKVRHYPAVMHPNPLLFQPSLQKWPVGRLLGRRRRRRRRRRTRGRSRPRRRR
jgi:hypothetical protein